MSKDHKLYRLDELSNYEVADQESDLRGWVVKTKDGITFGKVKHLLVDKDAMKVRYIDVQLNEEYYHNSNSNNMQLLIPIGAAHLHDAENQVYVNRISNIEELSNYPLANSNELERDYEYKLMDYYSNPNRGSSNEDQIITYDAKEDDSFYERDDFNQDRLYQNRRNKD